MDNRDNRSKPTGLPVFVQLTADIPLTYTRSILNCKGGKN